MKHVTSENHKKSIVAEKKSNYNQLYGKETRRERSAYLRGNKICNNNNNPFYFRQLRLISLKKQNMQKQTKTRGAYVQATHLFTDYTRRVRL